MEYLVYILAGFGIFSLLVLLLKSILWSFSCDYKKQFIPIGESEVYTNRNSVIDVNELEALDQMDQMLAHYTTPKVVVSRQCICPVCTKETEKLIIFDQNKDDIKFINSSIELENISENNSEIISEKQSDNKSESVRSEETIIEVKDIIIADDLIKDMPCNKYNSVVSELKVKFLKSMLNNKQTQNEQEQIEHNQDVNCSIEQDQNKQDHINQDQNKLTQIDQEQNDKEITNPVQSKTDQNEQNQIEQDLNEKNRNQHDQNKTNLNENNQNGQDQNESKPKNVINIETSIETQNTFIEII